MASFRQTPARLDVVASAANDLEVTVAVTSAGVPWDWTTSTASSTITTIAGAVKATNWTVDITVDGTLRFTLTDTDLSTLGAGVFKYAITITLAGNSRTWIAGSLTIGARTAPGPTASSMSATLELVTDDVTLDLEVSGSGAIAAEAAARATADSAETAARIAGDAATLATVSSNYVPFLNLAYTPDLLRFTSFTRSAGVLTSATGTAAWPDGSAGTLTITSRDSTTGAVLAYTLTYVPASGPTVTYTQPTMTIDSTGAVTARPAITVS